jgi:hypothetical protein
MRKPFWEGQFAAEIEEKKRLNPARYSIEIATSQSLYGVHSIRRRDTYQCIYCRFELCEITLVWLEAAREKARIQNKETHRVSKDNYRTTQWQKTEKAFAILICRILLKEEYSRGIPETFRECDSSSDKTKRKQEQINKGVSKSKPFWRRLKVADHPSETRILSFCSLAYTDIQIALTNRKVDEPKPNEQG